MNHRLAEDIIRKLATAPLQASIEARYIDVDRTEFLETGIHWDLAEPLQGLSSDAYIGGSTFGEDGVPTTAPTVEFPAGQYLSGTFVEYAKLTPTEFEAVMRVFRQSGKTELLSAPEITVVNNYTGRIEVFRPYPYISSYSIVEEAIEIRGDDFRISTAIPEIATREVGVMLEVTPSIGADRKVINLTLAPRVVQLVGAYEYPLATVTLSLPIFSVRTVRTNVDVNDGETLVLGGLIRGDQVKTTKRIPFFGRIPILGYLFRKEYEESRERELLIFVTARIIEPTGQPLIRD